MSSRNDEEENLFTRVEMKYRQPLGGGVRVASYGNHSGRSVHVQEGALVFLHGENNPLCFLHVPHFAIQNATHSVFKNVKQKK